MSHVDGKAGHDSLLVGIIFSNDAWCTERGARGLLRAPYRSWLGVCGICWSWPPEADGIKRPTGRLAPGVHIPGVGYRPICESCLVYRGRGAAINEALAKFNAVRADSDARWAPVLPYMLEDPETVAAHRDLLEEIEPETEGGDIPMIEVIEHTLEVVEAEEVIQEVEFAQVVPDVLEPVERPKVIDSIA